LQPGLEDAFAAAVEVVAVDEGEHGLRGWGLGGHGGAGYCMNEQYIGTGFAVMWDWLAGAVRRFIAKTS
jgi:hypothetical protein